MRNILFGTMSPIVFIAGQPDPILLWHWCLGHPSVQKLWSVVPIEFSIFSLDCESFELDKYHRVTYQSRVNNRVSITVAVCI